MDGTKCTEYNAIQASLGPLYHDAGMHGIDDDFEVYDGNHLNRIAERLGTHGLRFFSEHLDF